VVGDPESRLSVFDCFCDQFFEFRCAVEHRVLGVDMKVSE
jgi:hypothetical protein